MTFNYCRTQTEFWQQAPDKPGFKHVYAATFSALMHLLQASEMRSITVNYDRLNGLLKLSEEAYQESIKWLDEARFIVYFRGKNRHTPATIFVNVPEIVQPEISGSKGGSKGVSNQVLPGVVEPEVAVSPPPHPPIEDNIFSNQPAGRPAGAVETLKIPSNLALTTSEQADLLTQFGAEKVGRMLLRVSVYKRQHGGQLKASDYTNAVRWAADADDEDQQKKRRLLTTPALTYNAGFTTSPPAPVAAATNQNPERPKPYREFK